VRTPGSNEGNEKASCEKDIYESTRREGFDDVPSSKFQIQDCGGEEPGIDASASVRVDGSNPHPYNRTINRALLGGRGRCVPHTRMGGEFESNRIFGPRSTRLDTMVTSKSLALRCSFLFLHSPLSPTPASQQQHTSIQNRTKEQQVTMKKITNALKDSLARTAALISVFGIDPYASSEFVQGGGSREQQPPVGGTGNKQKSRSGGKKRGSGGGAEDGTSSCPKWIDGEGDDGSSYRSDDEDSVLLFDDDSASSPYSLN